MNLGQLPDFDDVIKSIKNTFHTSTILLQPMNHSTCHHARAFLESLCLKTFPLTLGVPLDTEDDWIERFSIECRKSRTKVITLANHKGHR